MSLYFSAAVWASLALCVFYSLADQLPRYRTEATVASWSSAVLSVANNLQQSWRFDGEPPKAVLRDVTTIDWIWGRLRSSTPSGPAAGQPSLGF